MKELLNKMQERENLLSQYFDIDWSVFNNKTVLDIGPAYGIWSMKADNAKAKSVKAIDVDNYWIKNFKTITDHFNHQIPIQKKNVLELDNTDKSDIVLFLAVWHHVPDYKTALDNVFATFKDHLFIEGPISEKETVTTKHKEWGKQVQQAFYWVPTIEDAISEIEKRNGIICKKTFNPQKTRMFLHVTKNLS